MNARRLFCLASVALVFTCGVGRLAAEEKGLAKVPGPGEYNPAHATVELFKGMESGQLEVKFIPRDATQGRILITNKAEQPLNVKLPDAFAAMPLAQFQFFQPPGQQGQPQQPQNNSSFAQPVAGPTTQQGRQGGSFPIFNIPAEQLKDVKVTTVCMAHGKPNPRPAIPYQIVPLERISTDPLVRSMLREFGQGKYSQHVAQAAAWNLANDMSWEKLSKLEGSLVAIGVSDPYFTKKEIQDAQSLVAAAEKKVDAAPVISTPGKSTSPSSSSSNVPTKKIK